MTTHIPAPLVTEILWHIRANIFRDLEHSQAIRVVGYIDRWINALAPPEPERSDGD
jgi:hypothetical protein